MKNLVLGVILFLTVMGGGIAVAADNSSTASNYKIESNGLNITPPVTPTVYVAQGLTDEKCRTFLVGAIKAGYDVNTIRDFIRTKDVACYNQLNNAVEALTASQTGTTYTNTGYDYSDTDTSYDTSTYNSTPAKTTKKSDDYTVLPNAGGSGTTYYNKIGDTVFGSDGSSYNKIGDTVFRNDGTYYNQIGDTTFSSDGTYYNKIGDTTFGSDGSTYNKIGDTTFGSDGSYSNKIGDTVFVNH